LLDVGAGLGHMVHRANERGWEADGLEVVEEACAIAGRMYGVDMHVGTLESVGDIGRFDVVSFGQTLEHLADPVATLRLVRERFLTPNGRVLIEAPNAQCLARFLQRRKWMHWQPGDHHTYPDLWSTRVMLQRAGFAAELVRSDSLTVKDASELVLAYNLGLLSERTWQLFPPTTRWLVKAKTYTPLKKLTEFVDERGFGQNVVAVGRSLS
jgi:SAM-dependent methyltransferase